jgi:hypothetical protein
MDVSSITPSIMDEISSIRGLIDLWPKRSDLAADLTALLGRSVSTDSVHKWASSGVIPAKYQRGVVIAGRARGFSVDADLMLQLHHPGNAEDAA